MSRAIPRDVHDAIVIGSGIGGLAAAAVLAKLDGRRVLVIERHHRVGGLTHTFRRPGGYEWDVGLHYVGAMARGTPERRLFDFITDGRLRWARMPEPFEKLVYPDFTFDVHGDPARLERDLVALFPAERAAIRRYMRDLRRAARWMIARAAAAASGPVARASLSAPLLAWRRLAHEPTARYLARRFGDRRLRALVASQWGDYGLAPARSSFGIHAMLATHYLDGAHYPIGGAGRIARCVVPVIDGHGGEVVTGHDVRRIVVEGDRAVGVEVVDRRGVACTLRAHTIISDAGAHNTYARLLPPAHGARRAEQLRDLVAQGSSAVAVYLGLREDPEVLGFRGENHWINTGYDHDDVAATDELLAGRPRRCYLSFPSMKTPGAPAHTAQIIAFADHRAFARWRGSPWRQRDADYEALKQRMASSLVALVDRHYPGFAALVAHVEVSTPLTVEHFIGSPHGAIYGLPHTPERLTHAWLGARTHIEGLHLAGADAFVPGVVGAAMGGVAAAGLARERGGFLPTMASIVTRQAVARRLPAA